MTDSFVLICIPLNPDGAITVIREGRVIINKHHPGYLELLNEFRGALDERMERTNANQIKTPIYATSNEETSEGCSAESSATAGADSGNNRVG